MVRSSRFSAGLLASAALCAVSSGAFADVPAGFDFDARWGPWGEIGATHGTEESSYGEIAIFAPLMQTPDSLFFTEIRGKLFETSLLEGNAMLGLRRMIGAGFNFGAWAGLDVRHTDSDNTFGQVSGGLEALSQYFDARVNGYLPFTDIQAVDGGGEVVLEGSNIFMIGGGEVALYGVDGEIGGRLPLNGNQASLGVYGGGFWFDHDDIDEAIAGGKARVELAFNDVVGAGSQFSAQYSYTDDNVRGERHLIGARLRIPLGAAPAADTVSPQWLRMADRIERDVDIVIGGSGQEPVEDAITGVDFDQVVMTVAPENLQTVFDNAGGNTLIIADAAGGTFAGNKTLNADQTLQGGGSTIQVRGLESGAIGNFTAPGSRPIIDFDGSGGVLRVADRTHLAGLDITGDSGGDPGLGNYGVAGGAGIFATFTDLDVSGVAENGFDFSNAVNSTVIFRDVSVSDTGAQGILFVSAAGAVVDFTNVWVSDTGSPGIRFSNADNAVVDFTNVWVSDTGSFGITFDAADGATATFTDVTFAGTIGNSSNDSDALIVSSGAPPPSLNGNIINNATNNPDLCRGDFTGTLTFTDGSTTVITDGVGCPAFISDRRLKRDVRLLVTRADGLRIYAFRYLWSDTEYVGVMAQDLVADPRRQDAAVMTPAGFYVVDYARLGLRMTTLDAWRASGPAALAPPPPVGAGS